MAISPHLRRIFSGIRTNSRPYLLLNQFSHRFLSTTPDQPKPSSLSARMSFVFDQIDAIEKEREQKDQALQRIRTWRNNRATNEVAAAAAAEKDNSDSAAAGLGLNLSEVVTVTAEAEAKNETKGGGFLTRDVELVHPWPEWIELMERLVHLNYFDCRRKDEDKLIADSGFQIAEIAEEALDFTRDWKTVQTACLNFGKDRFDILKPLSRQDIQVLVGFGCPSADKKVVFSAKLLRKLVHLDEGDVCSSCSLRSTCERAYLLTNKEDEARTIDIMRVLLTYGFNPVNGSVVNDSLMKIKRVKAVVRKLLHEVVKLSAVPIDPNLPPPVIKKPPPKVKQAPPPPRKRVGRDDVEMKKGDWLCPKCDFMNFAKNTVCLQCDAKRPKRQLLPGEWECPECNFLNYRRNMACFHCECKRPADEFTENQMQERQRGPSARLENLPSRKEVSDAWNFDFDDNESDGADVAAFEYADSRKVGEDFPPGRQGHEENIRGFEDGFYKNSRPAGVNDREYSGHAFQKPGVGFDDFEDEEDDIESYELDTSHNSNQVQRNSSINLSDLDIDSESEDSEATSENLNARPRFSSSRNNKASEPQRRKAAFSGSEDSELDFDSDKDLPVHPKWKSSHVASSRQRTRGGMEFGSEEDYELSSGDEEFPSRQNKGKGREGSTTGLGRRGRHQEIEDDISNFESDEEGGRFNRERSRGNKVFPDRRNSGNGRGERRGGFDFSEDARSVSRGMMRGERRNSFEDKFNHGGNNRNRGFRGDDFNGRSSRRNAGGETDARNSRGHRRENFANKQSGRFSKRSGDGSTPDSYLEDERYSRPRINVR